MMAVTLTEAGVAVERMDSVVRDKAQQNFYFNEVGVSRIQLYVYNKVWGND